MTDSSAPPKICTVCGQERPLLAVEREPLCPTCGRHIDRVDPFRLAEEALRREAGEGGWLVE